MAEPDKTEPDIVRLARLVRSMRDAQSRYFRDRSTANMRASVDLEKRVDKAVGYVLRKDQPKFPNMIGGERTGAYGSESRDT